MSAILKNRPHLRLELFRIMLALSLPTPAHTLGQKKRGPFGPQLAMKFGRSGRIRTPTTGVGKAADGSIIVALAMCS